MFPFPGSKSSLMNFDDANKEKLLTKPISFHDDIQSKSTPRMPLCQITNGIQNSGASDKENISYSKGSSKNLNDLQQQEQYAPKNDLIKRLIMLKENSNKPKEKTPTFGRVIKDNNGADESSFQKRQKDGLTSSEKNRFDTVSKFLSRYSNKFPNSTIPSTPLPQSLHPDAKSKTNFMYSAQKDNVLTTAAISAEAKLRKKNNLVVGGRSASAPLKPIFIQSFPHHHEPLIDCIKPIEEEPVKQESSSRTMRSYSSTPSFENLPPVLQRFQRAAAVIDKIFTPGESWDDGDDDDDDDDDDEEERFANTSENESENGFNDASIDEKSALGKLDISEINQENKSIIKHPIETQKETPILHRQMGEENLNIGKNPCFQNCERNRGMMTSCQNNRALHLVEVPRNISGNADTSSTNARVRCGHQVILTKENALISHSSVLPGPSLDQSLRTNRSITVNNKNYLKLNLLGKGGSSKVYLVYDEEKKQLLAVKKVSLEGAEPAIIEGYKNEINLLLKLQKCDRVVKLFDYEYRSDGKEILVVMEKGDTDLANALRSVTSSEPLSPVMIKFYWSEMLKAVREIHEQGIIHSDLKPTNFLLVSGKLKLIDFGISSSVQVDVTTSVIKDCQAGTINFMPPEALQAICQQSDQKANSSGGKMTKVSRKADIWSLGCILYSLVYGKTPFHHIPSMVGKLHAITNPNYIIEFPPVEDNALLNVLKSCLIRDPSKRPSIDDLLNDPYIKSDDCSSNVLFPARLSSILQQLTPQRVEKVTQYAISLDNLRKPPNT